MEANDRFEPIEAISTDSADETCRRVYREMVKIEIQDRPLTWRRRQALLAFAAKINLDPFEARIIVRAVEYECGHVAPAAMDEPSKPTASGYLAEPRTSSIWRPVTFWLALFTATLAFLWFTI